MHLLVELATGMRPGLGADPRVCFAFFPLMQTPDSQPYRTAYAWLARREQGGTVAPTIRTPQLSALLPEYCID